MAAVSFLKNHRSEQGGALSARCNFNNCAKLYLVVFHAISIPASRKWIRLTEIHRAFHENLFARGGLRFEQAKHPKT
jgi:hypothetical protein